MLFYVDTGNKYKIALPRNRLNNTLEKIGERYVELLFDEGELENSKVNIQYRYQKVEKEDKWYNDKIIIDLTKYIQ